MSFGSVFTLNVTHSKNDGDSLEHPVCRQGSNRVGGNQGRGSGPTDRYCGQHDTRYDDPDDEKQLAELDANIKGKEGEGNLAGGQPYLRERTGEAETVEQAERARDSPGYLALPGRSRVACQLDRHDEDARRDQYFRWRRRDVHDAEDRQRERDAVPECEGGDRPEQSPPVAHQQDEAEDEEQVVETRQDVLEAEHEVAAANLEDTAARWDR